MMVDLDEEIGLFHALARSLTYPDSGPITSAFEYAINLYRHLYIIRLVYSRIDDIIEVGLK